MQKQTITTRLAMRLGLAIGAMFASFGALGYGIYLLGEPKWLMATLLPIVFLFPVGTLIFLHMTLVCPYCRTFDPVGWLNRDFTGPIRLREACPTCHARLDKPFDPEKGQSPAPR